MVHVTIFLRNDRKEEADPSSDIPDSWCVHSCTIDVGADAESVVLSCNWVYASPVIAQHDMQQRVMEQLHLLGHTAQEDEIIWRVHTIG